MFDLIIDVDIVWCIFFYIGAPSREMVAFHWLPCSAFCLGRFIWMIFFLTFFFSSSYWSNFFIGRHSVFSFVFLPSFTGFYFEIVSHFDAMKNFVLFSLFIFEKKMHFKANCWVLVFLFVGNKIRNKKKEWMNRRATDRIDLIGRWRHGQSHFFVQIAEHREE